MSDIEPWLSELLRVNDEDEKMTDKQIKIVQAAVEIFAEKGFAGSSTSEIAQKAGVAEGTIFRHYKTKKELLLSIVAPMITRLIAPLALKDFTKVLDAEYARFEDFLRAVLRNRLEFARKNWPIIKILLHEVPFHPELKEQIRETLVRQVALRAEKVVKHFQAQGQIVELPPLSAIRLIVTTFIGFVLVRLLLAPDGQMDEELEIEHTIRFILYGLTPRGE